MRSATTDPVDADHIQQQFDDVCDQAIVYHGFTDYMRDYEILVYCTADPKTGIVPEVVRLLFKNCVVAAVETALTTDTWQRSLDDRLVDYATGVDLDGYVWGVKWQLMYPGGTLVEHSAVAARWTEALGLPFHEAKIATNGHDMTLVFSDLTSDVVAPGYTPFIVELAGGPDPKMPWG